MKIPECRSEQFVWCFTFCTVYHLVHGVLPGALCSTWCTVFYLVHGVPPGARSADYSPKMLNNLKHWHPTIVHSCIARFEINMHPVFIHLLTLILIHLIYFIIKTSLIYSIYIINIMIYLCPFQTVYHHLLLYSTTHLSQSK